MLAPGFDTATEQAEILTNGDQEFITIVLKPRPGTDLSLVRSGPPVLAPGPQKELAKAMELLRADKSDEAKKHLDKAVHSAPANPDVNYMLGMYYIQQKDYAHAEEYWKKAIQIYPLHTYSLSALGSLEVHNGQVDQAITYLKRAVQASPDSWRYEAQLGQAYLIHKECAEAAKHSKRAVELGKDRASAAQFILAKSYVCQNQRPEAEHGAEQIYFREHRPGGLEGSAAVARRREKSWRVTAAGVECRERIDRRSGWPGGAQRSDTAGGYGSRGGSNFEFRRAPIFCRRRSGCRPMLTKACRLSPPASLARCSKSATKPRSVSQLLSTASIASARPRRSTTKSSIASA